MKGWKTGLYRRRADLFHPRSASGLRPKPERYTRARSSRLCAYALLNLTRDFAQTHRAPDYARVLGFRKSAAPLLKTIKQRSSIPLITKAANFDRSNPLFALDVLAQDLWSLGVSNPSLRASGRDFTTSPAILSR
ncbi:MAG: nucleotidyltransferase family protein [Oscillospiraceae bacterium]